jgi:O-phosphoseryl-tRNA(Cys) synthetase
MSREQFETEDPMELIGIVMPGEPGQVEAMAECLVEEYARMGWSEEKLFTLFVNPMYMATYRIYRQFGEDYVQELINRTCDRWRLPETMRGENHA